MSPKTDLGRVITAMVTPFDVEGKLDLGRAEELAALLVANGNDGVVVGGTTGESPTLNHEEKLELYRAVGRTTDASVVACARVGAYRFVKLALRGPAAVSVVQLEWRRGDDGWRIVGGELVRSAPLGM